MVILHYRFTMPLLISLVEARVGSFATWPRVILQLLFNFPPTTFSVTSLTAFVYGNGLPCSMATQLVHACNDESTDQLIQQIYALYDEWTHSPYVRHLGIYWNMHFKRFVWINASDGPQLELLSELGSENNTILGFG
jgi:hypothetical protein